MAKKRLSDSQVEEILDSLTGIGKAEPRPFFYTRLQARMSAETDSSAWGRAVALISRPAVALAMLVVFLLVNGYILFNRVERDPVQAQEQSYQALAVEHADVPALYASNP
jgi:hypothetical protein